MPVEAEARAIGKKNQPKSSADVSGPATYLGDLQGSRAILGTLDGAQLHCRIEQLSDTGAYLLRSNSARQAHPLQRGDHIAIHLIPGIVGPSASFIVDGTIIRVEENGPGIAVRFESDIQDDDSSYNDLSSDDWTTEIPEDTGRLGAASNDQHQLLDFAGFRLPQSAANSAPATRVNVSRVLQLTLIAGLLSTGVAMVVLLGDWLGAVVL